MLTCKSPRKVMLVAHRLAAQALPRFSSRFSRHDFTLPQLFACLVVMEQQRRSYRGAEALLRDGRSWCRALGLSTQPLAIDTSCFEPRHVSRYFEFRRGRGGGDRGRRRKNKAMPR